MLLLRTLEKEKEGTTAETTRVGDGLGEGTTIRFDDVQWQARSSTQPAYIVSGTGIMLRQSNSGAGPYSLRGLQLVLLPDSTRATSELQHGRSRGSPLALPLESLRSQPGPHRLVFHRTTAVPLSTEAQAKQAARKEVRGDSSRVSDTAKDDVAAVETLEVRLLPIQVERK